MRPGLALACSLVAAIAPRARAAPTPPVLGGADAAPGAWPDAAAIRFGTDQADCSGTLVAPTLVLTAGHCVDGKPQGPDHALIGASSLARPDEGETIAIARSFSFPDPINSEDIAVLVLAAPSSRPPRKIATGWARADIANGAAVALVGFGAINKAGTQFVDALQEGHTTITDFDCSRSPGCNADAQPAGELGAGGMGVDTCPGDSGGPLYLITDYGVFLAGVTSRAYPGSAFACSSGGIYARPDKLIRWIEEVSGATLAGGPEPTADPIVAVRGDGGDTVIAVNDPRSTAHSFAITAPPTHGTAKVRGDGVVRVCSDRAAIGNDQLTVLITDTAHRGRSAPLTVEIHVEDGDSTGPCSFDGFDAAGCCDSRGTPGGALVLAICVLGLVGRRHRRGPARLRSSTS